MSDISDRLYRARLDALTAPKVREWREKRSQSNASLWWRKYGRLVGWTLMVVTGIGSGAAIVWFLR